MRNSLFLAVSFAVLWQQVAMADRDPRVARDAFMETVLKAALPPAQMVEFADTGEGRKFSCFAKVAAAFRSEGYARMMPAWVGGTPFNLEPGHLGLRLQCDIGGAIGLREISVSAKYDAIVVNVKEDVASQGVVVTLGCRGGADDATCISSDPKPSEGRLDVAFRFPDAASARRLVSALRQLTDMLREDDATYAAQAASYVARVKSAQETCASSSIKFIGGPWLNAAAYRSEAMHLVSYHAALIDGQKNPNFGQMCVNGHTVRFLCVHTIRYEGNAPDGGVYATATGFEEVSHEETSVKHHIRF